MFLVDRPTHGDAALQRAQSVDSLCISPWDIGGNGAGACGDQQMVEGFPLGTSALKLAHAHPPLLQVDCFHFVQCTSVDIVLLAKRLRGTSDQCFNVVDNLADVVGNPSSGI